MLKNNKNIIYAIALIVIILFTYIIYVVIQNNNIKKNNNIDNKTTDMLKKEDKVSEIGDVIVINYSGKLQNDKEFDSSYKRGQPFVFQVGVGQVIKGWDENLIGVKRGDKKTLTITPDKGYGNQDIKDQDGKIIIPKNSTLIFDVEVVDVISKAEAERIVAEQRAAMEAQGTTSAQ